MSASSDQAIQQQPAEASGRTAPQPRGSLRGLVAQNAAANLAGRALAMLFSAVAAILLARYLGAEKLGEYGAIYAYLALFSWLASFGFEPILVREISRDKGLTRSLLRAACGFSTVLSFAAVGLAVILAPLGGYSGRLRELLVLAAVEYLLTPLRMPAVMYQVEMRQWYAACFNVLRQAMWLGIVLGLWLLRAPLGYVIGGRVLAAAVETGLLWTYCQQFVTGAATLLRRHSRALFSQSLPIAFTSVFSMIYLRIDQVMLHNMVSDSVLGQYVAAVKVSELFEMLPSALIFAVAPILAVSLAPADRFRAYTDRLFRYFMLLAAAICVFMTIAAEPVVDILYGRQFLAAAPLLAVLIWSEIPVFYSTIILNVFIARDDQKLIAVPAVIGAAVNVALNLAAIPRYGALGAAWATLISCSVAWTVALCFLRRSRAVVLQGLHFALPITAVALAATGIVLAVPMPQIAKACCALVLFTAGAWLTRSASKADVNYFAGVLRESLAKVFS